MKEEKTIPKEKTLKIEVSKFNSIIHALSGDNWWRIMLSVFFVGCILFTGIATVALAIKRMYPYSDITTNGLGATTVKSEKSEVSYWLFNTAILWSNSGISVEKGDVISIRCSGKFHTAMHHVYEAAKNNTKLPEEWIGPEGVKDDPTNKIGSYQRQRYRIFPGMPTGALVMQVAANKPFDTPKDSVDGRQADLDNFYFIGGERENMYINNPGTLYFAVNDIVFNDDIIKDMLIESIREKTTDTGGLNTKTIEEIAKQYQEVYSADFNYLKRKLSADEIKEKINKETLLGKKTYPEAIGYIKQSLGYKKELPERINDKINAFVAAVNYKGRNSEAANDAFEALIKELTANRAIGKMRLGVALDGNLNPIPELLQYKREGYKQAWFDDNVGSFLIVVEKKTR